MSDVSDDNQPPSETQYQALLKPLSETKLWVKVCAVLGFISSAFMLIGGLFFLVGVPALSSFLGGAEAKLASIGAGFGIFLGLLYMLMGGILLVPTLYLYRYARSISRAENSHQHQDLVDALTFQKSFWKFLGILVLIYLVFMGLVFFFAVGAAFL